MLRLLQETTLTAKSPTGFPERAQPGFGVTAPGQLSGGQVGKKPEVCWAFLVLSLACSASDSTWQAMGETEARGECLPSPGSSDASAAQHRPASTEQDGAKPMRDRCWRSWARQATICIQVPHYLMSYQG